MDQRSAVTSSSVVIRPLVASDLDAVVAVDSRITGGPRRGYFEKRLESALRQPKRHLQLAATTSEGKLVGFALARRAGGEFGRPEQAMVLESIAVDPAARHGGLGQRLILSLEELTRARGVRSLVTQSAWQNHAMLKFIDAAKFSNAPRLIVDRAVHRMPLPATDEEIEKAPPLVRHLRQGDLDAVLRIDRAITDQDNTEYFRRKFDEVLNESAIAVSLVAEDDGFVVGYAMVRVDFGDFGHVEPTASLDTIGVNPGFTGKGFARAILTQMIDNLAALHVERLETEVAPDNFDLLRFLYRFGFHSSKRIPFHKQL